MSVDAHFSHPLKTCRWAKKQIGKFERAERRFFEKNPGEEFSYVEAPTALVVHGIEFKVRPTDALEEMAYRAVGDLRNALDQAVYAASKSLGVDFPKHANFPVGDSEKHFQRQLESEKGALQGHSCRVAPETQKVRTLPPIREQHER